MRRFVSTAIVFFVSLSMIVTQAAPSFALQGPAAAPQEEQCICTAPCEGSEVNRECPVCAKDPAACDPSKGEDPGEGSSSDVTGQEQPGQPGAAVDEGTDPQTTEGTEKGGEETAAPEDKAPAEKAKDAATALPAEDEPTGRQPAIENSKYRQTEDGPQLIRRVSVTVPGLHPDDENLYNLPTGRDFKYTISISNEDNSQLADVIRIYYDFSGTEYGAGSFPVKEGPYTLKNTSGTEYTMYVKACKDDNGDVIPGKFYYELTGIQPGETLAFQNDLLYLCPQSAGGTVKISVEALTVPQAEALEEKYIEPTNYVEASWTTTPVTFSLAKNNASSINGSSVTTHYEGDGSGSDTVYLKNLAYTVSESYSGGSSANEGKDYVREIDYEDVLTLPDESSFWREGLIEAVRNGNYRVAGGSVRSAYGSGTYGYTVYVTIDGKEYVLAQVLDRAYNTSSSYTNGVKNLKPSVVTDANGNETIKLSWHGDNPNKRTGYATSEYPAKQYSIVYGDTVIGGSLEVLNEKLDAGEKLRFNNAVTETRHYSFSQDEQSQASVNKDISLDASLETAKHWLYNNSSYTDYYGATDTPCVLYMKNTGIANLKDWGIKDSSGNTQPMITDTMTNTFYIKPENIEKMFDAEVTAGDRSYPVGDWLTITVTKGSFFTVNEGNETAYGQEMWAEDGAGKYAYGNPSRDNTELSRNATLTFRKVDGALQMTVAGSNGSDGTYTIGSGGDYATLDAAFKALGFMVTRDTTYKLEYQPGADELVLKSGEKLQIGVPLTMKTTYMMLDGDSESYSPSDDISSYNNATFRAHYAGKDQSVTRQTLRRDWRRESFLYKNGYIASTGKSISGSNVKVDDGNVIDYNVYFYRNNQGSISQYYDYESKSNKNLPATIYPSHSYEKMPIRDLVQGAQVVLVPKALNPDLTAPDGSALPVYTDSLGLEYWELNKPGTYENLTFGSSQRVKDTATYQYRKAETITVTREGDKSLSTLIKWQPLDNWGGRQSNSQSGSGTTNIWYKVLVSGVESGMIDAGDTAGQQYSLKNKCWQGDHQRHRLYDTLEGYFQVYSFSKHIAVGEKDGTDTVDDGTLVKELRIRKEDTVTYQIQINNDSEGEVTMTGASIYDALPNNRSAFAWEKGVNVKNLRYVTDGATVQLAGGADTWKDGAWENGAGDEAWSIQDHGRNSGQAAAAGQQYILWDDQFQIKFQPGGSVKILVDLEFPSGEGNTSVWANFVNANNGRLVYNTFYLGEQNAWRSDNVRHLPIADGKAVLRKGVYDTGWTTKGGRTYGYSYAYTSRKDRKTFANSGEVYYGSLNMHASTVSYYTELYNGSNERLYLEPLQDKLPKGFTFNSVANRSDNTNTDWDYYYQYRTYIGYQRPTNTYCNYTDTEGEAQNNSYRGAYVDNSGDETDNHTVVYVNARVTATTTQRGGNQYVTFTLTNATSNTYSNYPTIGYDSKVGKYYLDPGQAVRFLYNVVPGEYAQTEDVATNTIGMPFYNYYDTGFEMDDFNKLKPGTRNGLAPNDGECEQMTNEEVSSQYGFDVSKYGGDAYNTEEDGNWLVSEVTVTRENFVPGLQKSIGGYTQEKTNVTNTTIQGATGDGSDLYGQTYTGGVHKNYVMNWKLRAFSDGNSMTDYDIVDTVDMPYQFVGTVYYNSYHTNGNSTVRDTGNSVKLFTIGNRTEGDTSVRIGAGGSLSDSVRTVRIGSAADDSDDDWYTFGSAGTSSREDSRGRVKIEKLEDGREQITIELIGKKYTIMENAYSDFVLHTQFCSDTVPISEGKYNDSVLIPTEDYRAGAVTKGRALTHTETDENGKRITVNDGVQSGASLMVVQGYTSSSHKSTTALKNTTNHGDSDEAANYIILDEKEDEFRYDCYVHGPEAVMSEIVLIDSLPQEGDHSAFVDADKRNSEFVISLAKDPNFYVSLKKKGTNQEVALKPDQYRIDGTTKTEFVSPDWRGAGVGWKDISEMTEEEIANVRSIRLVIQDPNAWQEENTSLYMMPKEVEIHFAFNARINDPEAKPGEYGWNSFGYHYTVPENIPLHIEQNLMAQPLAVGVRFPCAPQLTKKLVDTDGNEHEASMDLTFNFLVYKGDKISALDNAMDMEEADIAAALAGRDYIIVPITVKKGESQASVDFWKEDFHLADYDDGWTEKDGIMHWLDGEQFNIVELPLGAYKYTFKGIEGEGNNYTFIQTTREVLEFEAVNEAMDNVMEVRGHKVWDDADDQDGVRPESITVNLLADGEKVDSATVSAETDWKWKFTDLPRYRETGADIEYTVEEEPVDGYEVSITKEELEPAPKPDPDEPVEPGDDQGGDDQGGDGQTGGDDQGGDDPGSGDDPSGSDPEEPADSDEVVVYTLDFEVTNTHEPAMTEIQVKKTWDDENDEDGIRPGEVTFRLYADGEEVADAKATKSNQWQAVFTDLPVCKAGRKITYTVKEDEVEDYKASIEKVSDTEWAVTNKHVPEGSGTETGDPSLLIPAAGLLALSGLVLLLARKRRGKNEE